MALGRRVTLHYARWRSCGCSATGTTSMSKFSTRNLNHIFGLGDIMASFSSLGNRYPLQYAVGQPCSDTGTVSHTVTPHSIFATAECCAASRHAGRHSERAYTRDCSDVLLQWKLNRTDPCTQCTQVGSGDVVDPLRPMDCVCRSQELKPGTRWAMRRSGGGHPRHTPMCSIERMCGSPGVCTP